MKLRTAGRLTVHTARSSNVTDVFMNEKLPMSWAKERNYRLYIDLHTVGHCRR